MDLNNTLAMVQCFLRKHHQILNSVNTKTPVSVKNIRIQQSNVGKANTIQSFTISCIIL